MRMDIIDTRDLIEKRSELTEQILDDFNDKFNLEETELDMVEAYWDDEISKDVPEEDKVAFREYWTTEFEQIQEINEIEEEIGSEFEYGTSLINVKDFEDYCVDLLEELGYICKDFPSWIEIDYKSTSENMAQDYSEITYQGKEYYYRE